MLAGFLFQHIVAALDQWVECLVKRLVVRHPVIGLKSWWRVFIDIPMHGVMLPVCRHSRFQKA